MKHFLESLTAIISLLSNSLIADSLALDVIPDARGSVQQLVYQTQQLSNEVRYSAVNYQVKSTVARFETDVFRLKSCVESTGGNGLVCPERCRNELYTSRNSFQTAEYYLKQTYYDFPRIYREYQDTRQALYQIQVGGTNPNPIPPPQPPGPTRYRCQANAYGFEEHPGGHLGFGFLIELAQRKALSECYRYHTSCRIVRCVQIN